MATALYAATICRSFSNCPPACRRRQSTSTVSRWSTRQARTRAATLCVSSPPTLKSASAGVTTGFSVSTCSPPRAISTRTPICWRYAFRSDLRRSTRSAETSSGVCRPYFCSLCPSIICCLFLWSEIVPRRFVGMPCHEYRASRFYCRYISQLELAQTQYISQVNDLKEVRGCQTAHFLFLNLLKSTLNNVNELLVCDVWQCFSVFRDWPSNYRDTRRRRSFLLVSVVRGQLLQKWPKCLNYLNLWKKRWRNW